MSRLQLTLLITVSAASAALLLPSWTDRAVANEAASHADHFWGQWRGPTALGLAKGNPPTEWSESRNIRWKREIAGRGLSTPIVWENLVIIQTAVPIEAKTADKPVSDGDPGQGAEAGADKSAPDGDQRREEGDRRGRGGRRGPRGSTPDSPYKFMVMALDRKTGETVWEKVVREEIPHEGHHDDGSLAPASPITDGEHLFAYFGSRGLYCLTLKGELVWEKDLGDMQTRNGFGEGSSPALHGDTLIVNWDHEGESFIVTLDKRTGNEKWRKPRDEATSWATPLIIEDSGLIQVVTTGTNRVRSYDLATGEVIWECGGLGSNCIPMPVIEGDHIFVMSGHRDPALLAIRYKGAKGDITGTDAVAWQQEKGTSYVPSPLLYGNALYFIQKNSEILSCLNPKTGEALYPQQRLEDLSGVYASPVGANGRVYIVGRNGVTYILESGPEFKVLATNKLDDNISASPAIAGDELFLRGYKHLYCIAAK